ncbi:Paraquat-inducible protein A [Seminavis robusta]|uniref:Paraquat-inducible protein A n=1 Tax=Seminavis robusta TaxID=568900 RepID=A0A9N8E604_9STRA|nr:Paraquat-inducible protein A [Seminavis robusta]|eukprot:Sro657_g182560.1 Paraquat-inducible protein A (3587) ;mRNA; r:15575-26590
MRILGRMIYAIAALAAAATASAAEIDWGPESSHAVPNLTSLQGYPGVLSREAVETAVEADIRNKVKTWAQDGTITTDRAHPKNVPKSRDLSSSSQDDLEFGGLNEILATFVINVPELNLMTDVIGVTATVNVIGTCGGIQIDSVFLDYKKGGSSTLTYKVAVNKLDVKCQFEVDWDLGVLDVSDKLKIRIVIKDSDFQIAVTLKGSPPDTATFSGCEALINLASIDSSGGFSSKILNELSDLIIEIVRNEVEVISDIVCDFVADFASTVDELLVSLGDTLAPYLRKVGNIDPLQLEKDLNVDEELVDLTDSTLGDVLQVFIDNLQGVIGAFQINTFIELNVLNKKGALEIVNSGRRRHLQSIGDCLQFRRRELNPLKELAHDVRKLFETEVSNILEPVSNLLDFEPVTNILEPILPAGFWRRLQTDVPIIDTENLFVLNNFTLDRAEIVGLNTFKDTMFLEIIGKQTLRTDLELEGLGFRVMFTVDFDINGLNRREKITATIPINGITVTASYLIGLSEERVNSLTLADLVNTTNLLPCLQSTLVAAGVSELDVKVQEVGTAVVEGVIDTGVDELINTAVEAAICTYQDLILTAVPNIFQNNVTVIVNDFLECYIRTIASQAVCVPSESGSVIISSGFFDDTGSTSTSSGSSGESLTFNLGEEKITTYDTGASASAPAPAPGEPVTVTVVTSSETGSTSASTTGVVEKITSFLGFGDDDELSAGFIDFRDLLLPPEEAKSLGGSGTQPYGDLIAMAFSMMRDKMASTDNATGMATINTEVIQPLTEAQSGIAGMFKYSQQLFNFSLETSMLDSLGSFMRHLDIRAFNASVGNVDTVVNPFSFLQPTNQAHVLENILHFGPVPGKLLTTTLDLNVDVGGVNTPITLRNEIGINATTLELDVLANLEILVPVLRFLKFPITDILNVNCWMALFQTPTMKAKGIDGVAIQDFLAEIASMTLNLECSSCTSIFLPQVLETFEEVGVTKTLGNRLSLLLEDVMTSDVASSFITELLKLGESAATLCPHSPTYNTSVETKQEELSLPMPPLSNRSIDSLVFATVVGAEIIAVLFAESHLADTNGTIPDSLVSEVEFQDTVEVDGSLLDWTRLNETFIPFAGDLLEMARAYLGPQDSGSLGVNQILGEYLNADGSWRLSLENSSFELEGLKISVDSVEVTGLDSFVEFYILDPVEPQTLQNTIVLDSMSLKIDVSLDATSTKDPPRPYSFSLDVADVNLTASLFVAVDMEKLAAIEIGSILFVDNILPCAMSAVNDMHVSGMFVSVGNISNPTVGGLLPDAAQAVSRSMEELFENFGSEMVEALNMAFDTSLRGVINNFLTSSLNSSSCASRPDNGVVATDGASKAIIDLRDLLLTPENALRLGGSGMQPYGDLFPTVFSMLHESILHGDESDGLLDVNSMVVDSFTEGQSGTKGSLRFQRDFFSQALKLLPMGPLTSLEQWLEASIFDARIDNINTLVGPLSLLQPSHQAHVLENMINFGPVSGRPVNTTLGVSIAMGGSLPLLNMHNEFNITASVSEIDVFADIGLQLDEGKLFKFPLGDILELHCWLAMVATPSTSAATSNLFGLELKTLLMRLVSLSMALECSNCTNPVLPELIQVLDDSGVSEVLGNRIGPLVQEIATGPWFRSIMKTFIQFGDDAARMCPHSPLFSQSPLSTEVESAPPPFPPLSELSLDSLLFTSALAAEIVTVLIADNHVQGAVDLKTQGTVESKTKDIDELEELSESSVLLDWTDLNDTHVPFIGQILDFVKDYVNGPTGSTAEALAINTMIADNLGSDGHFGIPLGDFAFEVSGLALTFHHIELQGLTSFSSFQVLHGIAPRVFSNNFTLGELHVGLNMSVDVLETPDPPKHVNVSLKLQDIDVSVPVYFAVDGERLASINIGSLLHTTNILPCLLSTVAGVRVQELLVSVKNIVGVSVHGFLPETGSALSESISTVLDQFGETITSSIPKIFDGTMKKVVNEYLKGVEKTECQHFSVDSSSPYIDFRELFLTPDDRSSNAYGDLIPLVKNMLDSVLQTVDPVTELPKVNDMIIAPLTAMQSGIPGTVAVQGDMFAHSFQGFEEAGIDHVIFELLDARIENIDTMGQPLELLEPNATNGFLLDNRATLGTELRPLRLAVKSRLRFASAFMNTDDEIELFAAFNEVPLFAVILARIGAEELMTYPLQYIGHIHCWLSTLVAPTLAAIARGQTEIDPALAIEYFGIVFSNFHLGASCADCSTPGLLVLPELLDILQESGAKDDLGRRVLEDSIRLLQSDFVQVWLLRFLQGSMRRCPRTASLEENNIVLVSPEVPPITPHMLETGTFAVFAFFQVGAVVLAETMSVLGTENVEPIFKDPEPNFPPETRLVDFTALDTYPVGGLVKYFLEGLNSYLGEPSIDPVTGESSLGINELLGANPLFELDTYGMEFEDFGLEANGVKISVKTFQMSGIDTFTKFRILDIDGPTSLQNELGWERLHFEVTLEAKVLQTGELSNYTATFEISDIQTSMELMLALDYELLKNLQLGSLLRMAYILPCIQAAVRHVELSKVKVDIGQISKLQLKGFRSQKTAKAAEGLESMLLDRFGEVLADATPTLFSVAVRPLLNSLITSYLQNSDFRCDEFSFGDNSPGFVDFRDFLLSPWLSNKYGGSGDEQYGDLIRTAYGISKLSLLDPHPENGLEMLTPVIGNLTFPGVLLNQGIRFDVRQLHADITLRVSDLSVLNLDSIGPPLSILAPIKEEAHQLNNTGTFGVGPRPVVLGARIYMHIKGFDGVDIVNDFDLSLDIHSATVVLAILLKISEDAFVNFPIRDILNINCWIALIPPPLLDIYGFVEPGTDLTAAITNMDFSASKLKLALDCHNCTSPALLELSRLLSAEGASEDVTDLANRVIATITDKLGGAFLQDQINRLLVNAPRHCSHSNDYDPEARPLVYEMFQSAKPPAGSYIPIMTLIFAPLGFALAAVLLVRRLVGRRQRKWLASLPSEQIFLIQQRQEKEDQDEAAVNALSTSMYRSTEIPFFLRQLIPVIIVVNIGFFLSGHLNDGGRVLVSFVIAGETFTLDDFFIFSIGQSTIDMWHAGGKELALLILLFSGVWPYTKQLITLALWFLPPGVVSSNRRGQFLLWLDILAKWSMLDIIVMIITVAGFRVSIKNPDLAFVPPDLYAIELFVVPMWGLYANMIAQVISQVSSHFIVHYHRRMTLKAKETYEKALEAPLSEQSPVTETKSVKDLVISSNDDDDMKSNLCRHSFSRNHRIGAALLIVRRYVNPILLFASLLTCVLMVVSCDIPSMKLETLGVVGLMIELGQDLQEAVRYEGVFSIAQLLMEQAKFLGGITNYIGLAFLAFLFISTVLVVPILQIATLLFHWFAPLTSVQRKKVAVFLEILQAWQYSEVYILAVIIESWQLGSVSQLMLNQFCTSLDFTLNLLVYYGVLSQNDAQCFALEASIAGGSYLLVPLTAGLALLNTFVVKAHVQNLREKEEANYSIPEDEKLRAFDRTTWDCRSEALRTIRSPDIEFTDTFRWMLRHKEGSMVDIRKKGAASKPQPYEGETEPMVVKPLGSDEEHGHEVPEVTETQGDSVDNELDESNHATEESK